MQNFKLLGKLTSQGKTFFRKEAGAVILIYALALIPIIGFIGLAVDMGQVYYAHSIISGAVDAAAIAGAKAGGNAANMQQQATAIFNANIPSNFVGTISGPNVTISSNNQTVVVSASANINTSFLKLFGRNTLSAGATAQAQATSTGAEVVLALDNTGSMAGSPMQGEIAAANLLVNTIYGGAGNDTVNGLWVAVVPYSTTVNINTPGLNPTTWLTTVGQAQVQNTNLYPNISPTSTSVGGKWMGCVEARTPNSNTSLGYTNYAFGMDSTDTPPTSNSTILQPWPISMSLVNL
jgi:Flp pilus assembly protein TadG